MQLHNNTADIPYSYNTKAKRKHLEVKFHRKCLFNLFLHCII